MSCWSSCSSNIDLKQLRRSGKPCLLCMLKVGCCPCSHLVHPLPRGSGSPCAAGPHVGTAPQGGTAQLIAGLQAHLSSFQQCLTSPLHRTADWDKHLCGRCC